MLSLAEFAVFEAPLVIGCDVVVAGVPFVTGVAEGIMKWSRDKLDYGSEAQFKVSFNQRSSCTSLQTLGSSQDVKD